jgi:Mg2+ and Co2+ transporter CorA
MTQEYAKEIQKIEDRVLKGQSKIEEIEQAMRRLQEIYKLLAAQKKAELAKLRLHKKRSMARQDGKR